jgi:shikimate kinase
MVLDPADRALVADADSTVGWLRARPETIAARVQGTDRPWLGDDPLASVTALAADRHPLYAELADVVVDVDDVTPEQAADTAARLLADRSGGLDGAPGTAADTMGSHNRAGGV